MCVFIYFASACVGDYRSSKLQMFLAPSVVAFSIAATRIHRGLVDHASAGSTEQYDTTPYHSSLHSYRCRRLFDPSHSKTNGCAEGKANRVLITRTQLSRMEVAIPEQDETPQMNQHGSASSLVDVEGQLDEKPAGLFGPDENVENGVGFAIATESSMT
jgi:hypothetical protein